VRCHPSRSILSLPRQPVRCHPSRSIPIPSRHRHRPCLKSDPPPRNSYIVHVAPLRPLDLNIVAVHNVHILYDSCRYTVQCAALVTQSCSNSHCTSFNAQQPTVAPPQGQGQSQGNLLDRPVSREGHLGISANGCSRSPSINHPACLSTSPIPPGQACGSSVGCSSRDSDVGVDVDMGRDSSVGADTGRDRARAQAQAGLQGRATRPTKALLGFSDP
jgi:hypothetical protein